MEEDNFVNHNTTPVTYTMQTSLVYFIKHFPQTICIWKARNIVEAKIVRFGWLALLQLPSKNIILMTFYFLSPNTTSCLLPMNQRVIRLLKCKNHTCIIKTITNAINNENKYFQYLYLSLWKCLFILGVKFQQALLLTASAKHVLKEVCQSDENDDLFSTFKSSTDHLCQRNTNLIQNKFTYKDI